MTSSLTDAFSFLRVSFHLFEVDDIDVSELLLRAHESKSLFGLKTSEYWQLLSYTCWIVQSKFDVAEFRKLKNSCCDDSSVSSLDNLVVFCQDSLMKWKYPRGVFYFISSEDLFIVHEILFAFVWILENFKMLREFASLLLVSRSKISSCNELLVPEVEEDRRDWFETSDGVNEYCCSLMRQRGRVELQRRKVVSEERCTRRLYAQLHEAFPDLDEEQLEVMCRVRKDTYNVVDGKLREELEALNLACDFSAHESAIISWMETLFVSVCGGEDDGHSENQAESLNETGNDVEEKLQVLMEAIREKNEKFDEIKNEWKRCRQSMSSDEYNEFRAGNMNDVIIGVEEQLVGQVIKHLSSLAHSNWSATKLEEDVDDSVDDSVREEVTRSGRKVGEDTARRRNEEILSTVLSMYINEERPFVFVE